MHQTATVPQAAYSISEFARRLGISRTTMYMRVLAGDNPPVTAKIGDRVLIAESPETYIRRVAENQAKERSGEAVAA